MPSDPRINHAAVLHEKNAKAERAIPTPGAGELLVRNHAIAVNPVDWKIQDYSFFVERYPNVLGSDVCGTVIAIGPNVTKFAPGDRVAGFAATIYNNNIDHGAYQTYTLLREVSTFRIPRTLSFEQGSVFPMAMATACVSLFACLGIPKPPKGQLEGAAGTPKTLLIWGGASSLGQCGIQVCRILGIKTYVTASTKHHEALKRLGAYRCFDYHDIDVEKQITQAAKDDGAPIHLAWDTISENGTLHRAADTLRRSSQGPSSSSELPVLSYVLWQPEGQQDPEGVRLELIVAMRVGGDQTELGTWFFNERLQTALEKGYIVPAPEIEIVPGGLKATQKAFDTLRGRVSGKKLVLQVE